MAKLSILLKGASEHFLCGQTLRSLAMAHDWRYTSVGRQVLFRGAQPNATFWCAPLAGEPRTAGKNASRQATCKAVSLCMQTVQRPEGCYLLYVILSLM